MKLTPFALFFLTSSFQTFAAEHASDGEAIQGRWAIVSMAGAWGTDGRGVHVVFKGDKAVLYKGKLRLGSVSYSLQPAGKARSLDITRNPGKVQRGIYQLDGDLLKVCVETGGKPRPATVSSSGSCAISLVLKRTD